MSAPFCHTWRLALVLALFPAAARAQNGAVVAPFRPAADAGDITEASRDMTESNITALVPRLLEDWHYSQHPFDAGLSSKFLDRYLDSLDSRHVYFLQSDLKEFDAYRTNLQTISLRQHDFSPATVIFSRFIERAAEQTAFVTNLLRTETFEFTNHDRFTPNRRTLPNPTNLDDAHRLWRQQLRFEYLDEKLKEGDMPISGPASFDAQSNVLILLPLTYTNSVSAKAAGAPPDGMAQAVRPEKYQDEPQERRAFEYPVPVTWLLPDKFLDQEHHQFGSITPAASNLIVRLQIPAKDTSRKFTNNFYSEDGQRLGSISFLHPADSPSESNNRAAAPAQSPARLKGLIELNRKDPAEIVKTLTKRYTGLLRNYNDLTNDDYLLEDYLTALAHAYDPHSDYMGHASMENFNIQMHLSLSGIGARLKSEDGDCKIEDLVPEGPAAKSGQITNDDIVVAVAQKGQEPVTVTGMPLPKVVEKIRGPKGTSVELTIVKAHPTDPTDRTKTITIVRDVVKLEDQAAKARFYVTPSSSAGQPSRFGVIELNSFYEDTEPDASGEKPRDHGTTTKDVALLISRMQKENVDGIILDLRRNGGGFLEEAIHLTGLFVKGRVPVVQTRSPDEGPNHHHMIEPDFTPSKSPVLYEGPLIVLISRFSASASEIVAGALQDYGRALIVGDKSTFGKGTVQTVQSMSETMTRRHFSFAYDPGSLKVTIKKFYRAGGASTQSNGVAADIVLPSILNYAEVGESSLPNPMPWDEVSSAELPDYNLVKPYLAELTKRSLARRQSDKDFAYLQEDIDEYRKTLADKSISLDEPERLAEQSTNAARLEARKKERASRPKTGEKLYEITMKNVTNDVLQPPLVKPKTTASADDDIDPLEAAAAEDPAATDPALTETRRIMADYISLLKRPLTAAAATAPPKEQ
ncbi:MAG TPA: carboxy terminal-processing peptidase [Candidatus Acidoferrum sp.]|nr:carboxy terminal-processing peptidase [Candidatus Acidoferrum sp.]